MKTARSVMLITLSLVASEVWSVNLVSDGPATYRAIYRVEHNGRETGTAEISVRRTPEEESRYEFTSVTKLTGVARLLVPNATIERSTFRYEDGRIVPVEFSYEDGRKGEGNMRVAFDWNRSVAITNTKDRAAELAVESGVLDRGSLQVAVMHDLRSDGVTATEYHLASGDAVETYQYEGADTRTVATGLGPISAQRFLQRRRGASRSIVLWMAPSLSYLPVRIERGDGEEVAISLTLISVDGLRGEAAAP